MATAKKKSKKKKTAKKVTKRKKTAKKVTAKKTKVVTHKKTKVAKRKRMKKKVHTALMSDDTALTAGPDEIAELSKIWGTAPDVSAIFDTHDAPATRGSVVFPERSYRGPQTVGTKEGSLLPRFDVNTVKGTDAYGIQALHKAWASGTPQGRKEILAHEISGAFPTGCIPYRRISEWMRDNGWKRLPLQFLDGVSLFLRSPDREARDQILAVQVLGDASERHPDDHPEYHPDYAKWISSLLYQLAVCHELAVLDLVYAIADKERGTFVPVEAPEPVALGYIVDKIRLPRRHPSA